MRRQFTAEQKAAVALAALKGDKTINQVASDHEVNPTQVKQWRDTLKHASTDAFADKRKTAAKAADTQKRIDELHRVIGIRDAELEWLKKDAWARAVASTRPPSAPVTLPRSSTRTIPA